MSDTIKTNVDGYLAWLAAAGTELDRAPTGPVAAQEKPAGEIALPVYTL
jgi:hypothetical protein